MPISESTTQPAFVALGSNLGDRLAILRAAVAYLANDPNTEIDLEHGVASLFETVPVGVVDQPMYFNSAMAVRTNLPPETFMRRLLEIERSLGRERTLPLASRTIDLDLLLYGNLICREPSLTLPHPHLHERRFVLEPLAEIAGEIIHPILGRTIRQLCILRRQDGPLNGVQKVLGPEWACPASELAKP